CVAISVRPKAARSRCPPTTRPLGRLLAPTTEFDVVLDDTAAYVDGPWTHRTVGASGARFHVAEAGEGPLVLFLHGFPEFWWAWRFELTALAAAGDRAVAADMRGCGACDKPPRGYDLVTLAQETSGLIRALGARDAVVVGHGVGGLVAWTMTVYHPEVVRAL